ncbi:hypothetical protein AB4K05_01890 [Kluyvera sp. STS39-E]|uniref:DUF6945 domain-containing protein n=1 Tax=Kluyvera sp. STS39-E TaxID=3234748 RepID=UPI0034C5B2EA
MNSRASQNKPELWIEEDRRLSFAESVTIKATGECFKVEDKLAKIHTYMVDQYNSYRKKGQSFYEDQRDIATKCKCSPKTLGKWMKVLETLGLLVIDESQKSHSYTVRSVVSQEHNFIFSYPKLLNGKPSYDHEEALKRLHTAQTRNCGAQEDGKSDKNADEQRKSVSIFSGGGNADLPANDDAVTGRTVVSLPRGSTTQNYSEHGFQEVGMCEKNSNWEPPF